MGDDPAKLGERGTPASMFHALGRAPERSFDGRRVRLELSDPRGKLNIMARKRTSKHVRRQDAFTDPGWPVPTPQAFHHFTLARQVDHLVTAREADPDLGFMARLLALCSLPRTNPGRRLQYVRSNGPYTLVMSAGGLSKLPYGNLPRLLMAWVSTEAVRTRSRELILGRSLSEFMRKLDIRSDSGGSRGERTRLRNQMNRLFSASVSLIYEGDGVQARMSSFVADRAEFWWDPKRPDDPSLWYSKIRLGEEFFQEIIRHPLPLDMNILKALKRSSLGLDLYMWLTYRTFALKKPVMLRWRDLYRQFGVNPAQATDRLTVNDFRKECLRELKKIEEAWPELNYGLARGALVVAPSTPTIPPVVR